MEVLKPSERLPAHRGNLPFRHDVERHDICQASTFHKLHDHPELAPTKVAVDKVDNVGVGALLHDQNLVDDQVLLRLLLQVHLLDGDQPVAALFVPSIYATRCTLPNLDEPAVHLPWIAFGANLLELCNNVEPGALPRPVSSPGTARLQPRLTLRGPHRSARFRLTGMLGSWGSGLLLSFARCSPQLTTHGGLGLSHGLLLLMLQ
jgi:hypothetical protein